MEEGLCTEVGSSRLLILDILDRLEGKNKIPNHEDIYIVGLLAIGPLSWVLLVGNPLVAEARIK